MDCATGITLVIGMFWLRLVQFLLDETVVLVMVCVCLHFEIGIVVIV